VQQLGISIKFDCSSTDSSVPTDVKSQEGLDHLISVISKDHDSVDVLFVNGRLSRYEFDTVAGVMQPNPVYARPGSSLSELYEALASSRREDWDDTFQTNVESVFYTVVSFIPLLGEAAKKGQGRGSVVITGSASGIHWDKGVDNLHYATSKAFF